MKPMNELSRNEIAALVQKDIENYEVDTNYQISLKKLEMRNILSTHKDLAFILKRRCAGYHDVQKTFYMQHMQRTALKKEIQALTAQFIQLRRIWEQIHGLNQVRTLVQTANGTPVLAMINENNRTLNVI